MACEHRNIQDLTLEYVDWEPKTLFIGTFNPGWQSRNNYAEWFYGRTQRNEFWCILPQVHQHPSLLNGNRETWINFCREHQLAITDIITSIDDADERIQEHRELICEGFEDDAIEKNFKAFTFTDIPSLLTKYPSIRQVCITRMTINGLWKTALTPTINACFTNSIAFRPLRSPSRGARKGVKGPFCQFIANHWQTTGNYQP